MARSPFLGQVAYFLRGWKRKVFGGPPIYLTYFVTSACNASCIHCLNSGRPQAEPNLLSPSEVDRIAASMDRFHNLLLSGGEPFLRPDLAELVEPFVRRNRVGQISIPTNGSFPDRIEAVTRRLAERCPETKINLRIAIDGPPALHNRIRGVENGFELAMETAGRIASLAREYDNVWLEFCFTMSRANEDSYGEVLAELGRRGISQSPYILLCRPPTPRPDIWNISHDSYLAAHQARERRELRRLSGSARSWATPFARVILAYLSLTRKKIARYWDDPEYRWSCSAGHLSLVMDETGTVYPCETTWRALGNLRDVNFDMQQILDGDELKAFRKSIRGGCRCTHETNVTLDSALSPSAPAAALRYLLKPPRPTPEPGEEASSGNR